jgi:hypothetical protein
MHFKVQLTYIECVRGIYIYIYIYYGLKQAPQRAGT